MKPARRGLALAALLVLAACDTGGGMTRDDAFGTPDVPPDVAQPDVTILDISTPDLHDTAERDLGPDTADVPLPDAVGEVAADAADAALPVPWVEEPIPLGEDFALRGLWGAGDDRLFAVGVAGTVLARVLGRWEVALAEPTLDILNAVAGTGPDDAWAVGMGGHAVHFDGVRWRAPDVCTTDADCEAGGPCRTGTCVDGACAWTPTLAAGCCGTTVFADDFEGPLAWDVADLYADDPDHGGLVWQTAALTAPGGATPRATSVPGALYFGDPARQDYDNGRTVGATATSPAFPLPADAERATLRLQLFLDVEASRHYDVLTVFALDGADAFELWKKDAFADGTTDGTFVPVTADMTPLLGRTVRLQLRFDTREQTDNDFEGVYVDDVAVETTCGALSEGIGLDTTLWGVFGAAPDDYFAVGSEGTILRYDGRRWKRMMGGAPEALQDIDGFGPDEMHMVGLGGVALHGPKGGFAQLDTATTADLHGVWVASRALALAVGAGGTALRYDGVTWTALSSPTTVDLAAVHGSSPGDAVAVGADGTILQFDGARLQRVSAPGVTEDLYDVWRSGPGDTWVAGDGGALYHERGPGQFERVPTNASSAFYALHVFPNGEVFAAGWGGQAFHRRADGTTETGFAGTAKTIYDLDGVSPSDLWGVGMDGTIIHYDGSAWSQHGSPVEALLGGVYAAAADDVWAVAEGGLVLHYDGREWTLVRSAASVPLYHVWGSSPARVFAVGAGGTILHFDGVNWRQHLITPVDLPGQSAPWEVTETLRGVWGTAADDVWAVGGAGVVVHFDGTSWTYTPTADERRRTLWAVWGRARDDVWAVGAEGVVLHYDGASWSLQATNSIATLFGVFGLGEDVWTAGSLGTVLRLERDAP